MRSFTREQREEMLNRYLDCLRAMYSKKNFKNKDLRLFLLESKVNVALTTPLEEMGLIKKDITGPETIYSYIGQYPGYELAAEVIEYQRNKTRKKYNEKVKWLNAKHIKALLSAIYWGSMNSPGQDIDKYLIVYDDKSKNIIKDILIDDNYLKLENGHFKWIKQSVTNPLVSSFINSYRNRLKTVKQNKVIIPKAKSIDALEKEICDLREEINNIKKMWQ